MKFEERPPIHIKFLSYTIWQQYYDLSLVVFSFELLTHDWSCQRNIHGSSNSQFLIYSECLKSELVQFLDTNIKSGLRTLRISNVVRNVDAQWSEVLTINCTLASLDRFQWKCFMYKMVQLSIQIMDKWSEIQHPEHPEFRQVRFSKRPDFGHPLYL